MRTVLKLFIVTLALVVAGAGSLNAQSRRGDRLPRVLDPLGILPTPRQVLRTLDHVARALPPVVIETRRYPGYEQDYDYRSYPVQDRCDPPPVRRRYIEVEPYPRGHRHGHRRHDRVPYRSYGYHD